MTGSRSERSWPYLAALVLCAAVLHFEVLFRGAVYHMDDAADSYYPGHSAVARAFAHGELPTWERGAWCGWPLVVDPYNGVFYPLNVVYYTLGAARGLGYAVTLHILLGGIGVWLLLRRRGLGREAALFGALAYALSTFGVVRIRHVIFVQMMGWLPWILVGVEGWISTRRRRELALVAFATGMALVAGALSIGHFAALTIATYAIARSIRRPSAALFTDLGGLGLAALTGALIACAQLVPTLAHMAHSPRALGSDYAFASTYAWPNLKYLITLLAPDLFGTEDRSRYFGAPNHWELCGWYVGALCVLAAPLALLRTREGRRGLELVGLGALVLLAVGLALGDAGPLHAWFFRHVPLYAALRCPARALLMAVIALPILGAHGVAALLERIGTRPARRAALLGALATVAVGVASAVLVVQWAARRPPAEQVTARAVAHLGLLVLVAAAVLFAAFRGVLSRRLAGLALAVCLAVDLLVIGRGYTQPQPARYPAGMERFAAVEWLLAHPTGDRFVNDPDGPFRLHNVGMVLGLENASGYDSVPIWRYVDFLYLMANGRPYPERKLKHDFAGIGVHRLSSRLVDLMNVRWLIATNPPDGRWVERFRPPPRSRAPAAEFEARWDALLKVFENTTVLPRAFLAYRASVFHDDERLAARLVDPAFDPGREVLLEEPPPIVIEGPDRPPTPARIVESARGRLVVEADGAAPAILFVADAFYPGWRVRVDSQPAKLLRADWAFRGVAVPAGHHRVEFEYRSTPVTLGIVLSLVGLCALAPLGRTSAGRRARPVL